MVTLSSINQTREFGYPTPFTASPWFSLLLLSLASQRHAPKPKSRFKKEYDYIIVGGGAAGSVVASRLSEIACVNVLLLEAGGFPPRITEVPGTFRSFMMSDLDWKFQTTPQQHTGAGLKNKSIQWASGKTLGGGSTIGSMSYSRGNRKNYDDWERQGATGWSYEDVLPYFQKLENYTVPERKKSALHGHDGPITVSQPHFYPETKQALEEAAKNLKHTSVDPDGEKQTGSLDDPISTRNGQRCSTAKAYLVPGENRTNLDILTNAFVRKIIIENKRAVGVEFDFNKKTYKVRANKEVILSAGTVKTAHLLMLSGIGPMSELTKFNIPVVADLPVGFNLQDHPFSFLAYEVKSTLKRFVDELGDDKNILQYIYNRTGPLTSAGGEYLRLFLPNYGLNSSIDHPDRLLHVVDLDSIVMKKQINLKQQLLHPKSRGTISLISTNPYHSPLIDPSYYADYRDVEDVVQGLMNCNKLMSDPDMRKVGAKPLENLIPGCEYYAGKERMYLNCVIRTFVGTTGHYVGTAKMGHSHDPTTVVDPQLRVKHVKNLRVVDASIMPVIPWGPTLIPTVMVAEKASDIIKKSIYCMDYGSSNSGKGKHCG
ncbi:glucose dehydrogenase [FAD, quinone]-like [Uloborus diversus]|uniref:glucose dehydrogenase [FAD, quinone]-like n=1 Tax=Uloborus diversus TaxID=327109 RepID=UPI00240916D5|nr:glucose dehydrogenase [FAD, quinone]-like [Uloborus diversus]